MTPAEFKAGRAALGLNQTEMAAMLGYTRQCTISWIETGKMNIGPSVLRLMRAYLDGYRPADWPGGGE